MTRRWGRYEVSEDHVTPAWPVAGAGVRVVVDGRDVDLAVVGVDGREGRLAWTMEGAGVAVECVATPDGEASATVSGTGRLQRIDLERWAVGPGLGQPVLGDGWFAALEHPAADGLGLALDVDLGRGPYVSPKAVVRAAPAGQELSALWDELDRVRARPPGLVVLANNWYQLGCMGRMDEASVAAEMEGFRSTVPVPLDWYCLDDPWDGAWAPETGIWGRMDPGRFGGGLGALQAANGGRVGLWISPWGGYFDRHDARVNWGRDDGFEVTDGAWPRLCLAGDRYRAHVAESMGRFTAAGVGYWKIDGVHFDCDDRAHGHAVGPGGQTDQMDRFAALLDGVREAARPGPDPVLAFTSGSNPSPWWLAHADFVWRGGLDDDAPAEFAGGRHDRFATYIDACLDALRTSGLPVSSIVTFSLVENQAVAYRTEDAGLDAWERHCWLLAGRGTHHHDLYVAPDSLSRAEWDVLARALAWARAHERTLARSRMVGGRPQAGEPYGFVSTSATEGQAIVCLRNPAATPQAVRVDVGGRIEDLEPVWGKATADGPTAVAAELGSLEVALATGRWQPGARPGPPG